MEHKRRRLSSILDDEDFDTELQQELDFKIQSLDSELDTYTDKICKFIYISVINLISICFR
jgi:hypothetical protein